MEKYDHVQKQPRKYSTLVSESLFKIKLQTSSLQLYEKETQHRDYRVNFAKFLRIVFKNFDRTSVNCSFCGYRLNFHQS